MSSTESVRRAVSSVAGRVRFWGLMHALVRAAKWSIPFALVFFILDKFVALPWYVLLMPVAEFAVLLVVFASGRLRGVNRFEVAKIIDDQMSLKDRLTSALYFEALDEPGELAQAAVAEADRMASTLDLGKLSLGTWPKHAALVGGLAALTVALALGPMRLTSWFQGNGSSSNNHATKDRRAPEDLGTGTGTEASNPLLKAETRKPITELAKLETERPPERDPRTMDTAMSDDVLRDIEAIKATVDLKDMKDMEDAFKDDEKKPKDPADSKPPPIAPLDQDLLDDIARADKTKSDKADAGKDDAIGVAVKMPSKPGAKSQGLPKKGSSGHGGGDVGESADTRGAAKRVPIAGREKLVIDSRKSGDLLEKTDLEKSIMSEVMMRLSMKDVEMKVTAVDVPAKFTPGRRDTVVEETIPPGLRGYVQRYFEGLAPRQAAPTPVEPETVEEATE